MIIWQFQDTKPRRRLATSPTSTQFTFKLITAFWNVIESNLPPLNECHWMWHQTISHQNLKAAQNISARWSEKNSVFFRHYIDSGHRKSFSSSVSYTNNHRRHSITKPVKWLFTNVDNKTCLNCCETIFLMERFSVDEEEDEKEGEREELDDVWDEKNSFKHIAEHVITCFTSFL